MVSSQLVVWQWRQAEGEQAILRFPWGGQKQRCTGSRFLGGQEYKWGTLFPVQKVQTVLLQRQRAGLHGSRPEQLIAWGAARSRTT